MAKKTGKNEQKKNTPRKQGPAVILDEKVEIDPKTGKLTVVQRIAVGLFGRGEIRWGG